MSPKGTFNASIMKNHWTILLSSMINQQWKSTMILQFNQPLIHLWTWTCFYHCIKILLTFEFWPVFFFHFFKNSFGVVVALSWWWYLWRLFDPFFDRVTSTEHWPSGSRRRVSPSFSSATSKALLRLYRALDFCSLSYWIKSGLKSKRNKLQNIAQFYSLL